MQTGSVRRWLRYPLVRYLVIEVLLFAGLWLASRLFGWDYSMALVMVGAVLMVVRFSGIPRLQMRPVGVEARERQYVRDAQDIQYIKRSDQLGADLLLIGLLPVVAGIALAMTMGA